MNDSRRYHKIIENQVDMFVDLCKKIIDAKGLKDKIWVIKDEDMSAVSIGDPDKMSHNKDFGFTMYYEMIVNRLSEAAEEFDFKLEHFIKVANSTDRFKRFKNNDSKDK
jgi:hypothetical protein